MKRNKKKYIRCNRIGHLYAGGRWCGKKAVLSFEDYWTGEEVRACADHLVSCRLANQPVAAGYTKVKDLR
jgi:hypothetical protein